MIGPKKKMWGVWITRDASDKGLGRTDGWIYSGSKYLYVIGKKVLKDITNLIPDANYSLIPFNKDKPNAK